MDILGSRELRILCVSFCTRMKITSLKRSALLQEMVLDCLCFLNAEQRFWGITAAQWACRELSFVPDIVQVTFPIVALHGFWLGVEIPLDQLSIIMKNTFKERKKTGRIKITFTVQIISQLLHLTIYIHSAKLKLLNAYQRPQGNVSGFM